MSMMSSICAVVNRLRGRRPVALLDSVDFQRLWIASTAWTEEAGIKVVQGIVFSMDRAMQLHALLNSYREQVEDACGLTVLFRASSQRHEAAYREVLAEFSELVEGVQQTSRDDFKPLLLRTLEDSQADCIFFLVDDNLFVEPTRLSDMAAYCSMYCVPTLRLGLHLRRSYTTARDQPLPKIHEPPAPACDSVCFVAWRWRDGILDWNYPLSVDGHFFLKSEILALCKAIEFDSPNLFEEQLQHFRGHFEERLGICYPKSRLVNIPYNKVQTDNSNLHGDVHQDDMLAMWETGQAIDFRSYYGVMNESAHQEMPLRLQKRASEEQP